MSILAWMTSGSVAARHAERLEDRAELADRLVGAGDDLLGHRRAFG
jgi:predicted TIM-barrel enzyme